MSSTAVEVVKDEASTNKWEPKRWRAEYTEMVSLSVLGMSNELISAEIFKKLGIRYTAQHVSNVLNTSSGRTLIELMLSNINAKAVKSVPARLEAMGLKAIQRVEEMLDDDDLAKKAPLAVADRAMKIAQATGFMKPEEETQKSNNNWMIPADSMKVLVEAIKKSDEVKVVNAVIVEDADIVNV